MQKHFTIIETNTPNKFLGIIIVHNKKAEAVVLHQSEFTNSLVMKFNFRNERVSLTPMVPFESTNWMLEKEGDEKEERSITGYQSFSFHEIIGSLL